MENKLVSIIIPTYRRSNMLRRAILSVLDQTYKNYEILVIDDNNSDSVFRAETENIMKEFLSDHRICYIKHPFNKNGAAARNTGINNASGDYITFLDDDDYYLPEKIEKEVSFLEHNETYGAVYCGRFQDGKYITPKLEGDLSKEILLLTFTPTTPTLMFRKQILLDLNGFNESFKRHQDFELLLRFFENNKIGFVKEILVVIGQNEGENELHGITLEANKKYFLNLFDNKINKLNAESKGFKNKMYNAHYSSVFWDHISQLKITLALKIYVRRMITSPIFFSFALFKHVYRYLTHLLKKRRKTNDYDKRKHFED
jgi:glycosyltransferase involved in cell wall biosynthesis